MRSSLAKALAAGGTVLALAGTALAADQIVSRDRPPAAAAVTIDSSAPLFQEAGLVNGQTFERCTTLTNEGPQPADVTLFGTAEEAGLSPWLDLELVRGTLPGGAAPGSCSGFVADADDHGKGPGGVVFRGTLASLPDADAGIADPTRWAVGEQHSYLLRVHYTGDDPQQGLRTVQSFNWGATPFDDRPPDPFVDDGSGSAGTPSTPLGDDGAAGGSGGLDSPGGGAGGQTITDKIGRACTVITFPDRSYVGARAISRPKQIKGAKGKRDAKAEKAILASSADAVIASGESESTLGAAELDRRAELLAATRRTAARRMPVLVVRLLPQKDGKIAVRVGLRKNGTMNAPKRWEWVRVRINSASTKSTLRWPFTATADTKQLKLGYNQLDLTLNRGDTAQRLKGLPRLMRRSFAFVVGLPGTKVPGGSDCTLG